jgi:long-chain acyl-CoA synthetase
MVILINRFTLTASPEKFEETFEGTAGYMRSQPGFIRHTLARSLRDPASYVNIAVWEDVESHVSVVKSAGFAEHIEKLAQVAHSEPDLHAVVQEAGQ